MAAPNLASADSYPLMMLRPAKLAWRFYTVPGNPAKGFESGAMRKAAETWTGEWWNNGGGGGTPWDSFAYDSAAKLLYVGTGNGSAWDRKLRSPGGGDNLYLSSIVALRVATGELVWYYQTTPGDQWDYTAVQQMTLADLQIAGKQRKVIMQAPKNGFFYVLDRLTGELLSAEPYAKVTWAKGIDMKTGRPIEDTSSTLRLRVRNAITGARRRAQLAADVFQPDHGIGCTYRPSRVASTMCANATFTRVPGFWNMGIDLDARAGSKNIPELPASEYESGTGTEVGAPASLLAWDPIAAKPRWRVKYTNAAGGGTMTTAGNLVFQGLSDGRFLAYAADTGEKLWEVQLGNGIIAAPSTWSLDGKQYVSVLVGWGGAVGLYVPNGTHQYKAPGRLFTFVLDGDAKLDPVHGIGQTYTHGNRQPHYARGRRARFYVVCAALFNVSRSRRRQRRVDRRSALCVTDDLRHVRAYRA